MKTTPLTLRNATCPKRHFINQCRPGLALGAWCLALSLILPPAARAQFACATNNGKLTITRYSGAGGSVVIPEVIDGLPVTGIGDQAFGYSVTLTEITIPDGVTHLGAGAFTDCIRLSTVTLGSGITRIEERAFFNCAALEQIQVPRTLSSIGVQAFYDCTRLTGLSLPNSLTNIGSEAFSWCTALTGVSIPAGVTNIGDYAFHACGSLSAITVDALNPSYSSLAGVLFNKDQTTLIQCPGAKADVYAVPNGVSRIAASAFVNCNSLTNVTVPNSVTNIGDSPFGSCSSLSAIVVDALNPSYSSLGGVLFNKDQTTLIQFPAAGAGSYSLPDSVTNIQSGAFIGCKNLSAIRAGSDNPAYSSVGGVLFNKLQTTVVQCPAAITGAYEIPNTVLSIGEYAFVSCSGLTAVTIPEGVKDIGLAAFAGCTSLTSISIPDSVTNIAAEAFEACARLANLSLGARTSRVGIYAFYQCAGLTSLTLPSGVGLIEDRAFQACTGLKSITITAGVTNIGAFAFGFCTNLTSVYFSGNRPEMDPAAFGDDSVTLYYLPGSTGWGSGGGGAPSVMWDPSPQTSNSTFGIRSNAFGFNITGGSNLIVVVEACADAAHPVWFPLQTNQLIGGSAYFSDPDWTNYPARVYRICAP